MAKFSKNTLEHVAKTPFPAYEGDEPYVFVSYAHADANLVFPELKKFHDDGINIWYDQGIAPGNEWTTEIAEALEGCSMFIVFISENSAKSINVRNEIHYALDEKKPFISIYLEETELPPGLKLAMGSRQSLLKYTMRDSEYIFRCRKAFARNGFKISGDSSSKDFKADLKETNKAGGNKLLYVAILAIVILIVVGGFILSSGSLDNINPNSTEDTKDILFDVAYADEKANISINFVEFEMTEDTSEDPLWKYSYYGWGEVIGADLSKD
jgi:hypothetical protein